MSMLNFKIFSRTPGNISLCNVHVQPVCCSCCRVGIGRSGPGQYIFSVYQDIMLSVFWRCHHTLTTQRHDLVKPSPQSTWNSERGKIGRNIGCYFIKCAKDTSEYVCIIFILFVSVCLEYTVCTVPVQTALKELYRCTQSVCISQPGEAEDFSSIPRLVKCWNSLGHWVSLSLLRVNDFVQRESDFNPESVKAKHL